MAPDPAERRTPVTPQLAIRVAGLSVAALVLFGIVFFRLWYLQVLDSNKYLAEARQNRGRSERIDAPRGDIVDAKNRILVSSRRANVVTLDPRTVPKPLRDEIANWGQATTAWAKKPKKTRGAAPPMPKATGATWALFRTLGGKLQMSANRINTAVVASLVRVPYADIRIKVGATQAERFYLAEYSERFPGVSVQRVFVRSYPAGSLAAHLLGTVNAISEKQVGTGHFKGIKAGSEVGQTGLEYAYNRFLQGIDGVSRIEVNAQGERRSARTDRAPRSGRSLQVTLDLGLQQYAERQLAEWGGGRAGAFVAMNPRTGAIYAMASTPTFSATDLARPRSQAAFDRKFRSASSGSPLFSRATQAGYPTGSIFKPITALAALTSGTTTAGATFDDTGCLNIGTTAADERCNAKKQPNGPVNMVDALRVSSDTYFYNQAVRLNALPNQPLQRWARRLGLGRDPGIDVPEQSPGVVPDRAWRQDLNDKQAACVKQRKAGDPPCLYADGTNRPWTTGDEVNLAVGQGDLQATPLQMAVMYSTIINGGTVPRPHVGADIYDDRGQVEKLQSPSTRRVAIPAADRDVIMQGLSEAANDPGGTSTPVWAEGWPKSIHPIWGKTGTAQHYNNEDQSWYAGYSYTNTPDHQPIVVIATIEDGGFGAERAAPLTCRIMSKFFNVTGAKCAAGDSTTR
jgi:penicillin-binding protein 2